VLGVHHLVLLLIFDSANIQLIDLQR
jgi:hypothetical protein